MSNKPTILVICGPTASGKTSLALSIASVIAKSPGRLWQSRVNLLSADSRQIYKGLDIVTGKDIPPNLPPAIKFFGLDLISPDQSFNLSDYATYAQKIINDSIAENIPLIIVGGTGLYLRAITSNLLNVHVPPNPDLRMELEKLDLDSLKKKLQKINPVKFSSLNNSDVNNPRRLIRAIEISLSLRDSYSNQSSPGSPLRGNPSPLDRHALLAMTNINFHCIGIHQDKETQKSQINQRVLDRLDVGAIDEVEKLIKKYPNSKQPIFTSLGVKEIIEFLNKKISREELINRWTFAEIDYARRQMVWFKKQPGIIWYDRSKINKSLAINLAELLKQND